MSFAGYIYTGQPGGGAFVVTADELAPGAGIVLGTRQDSSIRKQIWVYDELVQMFVLSEPSGTPLVIDAAAGQDAATTLQPADNGKASQRWNYAPQSPYLISAGYPGYMLDNDNGVLKDGNPILCYHEVGGPNQRWVLVPTANAEAFEASHAASTSRS